ncbi:hypothetical protein K502DRAFT_341112 [Neoconidiobolus thromboides FSU 785]|nr:hypothetical protein K502DRAFT_341112 [Neoconidiobolus thromboides FSU 785]
MDNNSNVYDPYHSFKAFCDPNTKLLSIEDIIPSLRAININIKNDDLKHQLLEAEGLNKNSAPINFGKFKDLAETAMLVFDPVKHYIDIFRLVDKDSKGYINLNDLRRISGDLNPAALRKDPIPDEELIDMLEIAKNQKTYDNDIDGDKGFDFNWLSNVIFGVNDNRKEIKLSLKEFCKLMDRLDNSNN